MCKHIHAVCRINKAGRSLESNVNSNEDDSDDQLFVHTENEIDTTEKQEILSQVSRRESFLTSMDTQKEALKGDLIELVNSVTTLEELEVIKRQTATLKATLSAIRSRVAVQDIPSCSTSQKRNIVPQRRLHSTKKRKLIHGTVMVKPNETDVQNTALSLLQKK